MKTPDLAWRGRIGTFNIGAGAGVSSWYGCYLLQQGLNQLLSACLALVTLTSLLVIGNVERNNNNNNNNAFILKNLIHRKIAHE